MYFILIHSHVKIHLGHAYLSESLGLLSVSPDMLAINLCTSGD